MNDLWKQAQKLAKENYEEENGLGSWDDTDKYERQDCVYNEYEKLGGFELEDKETKLRELREEFSKHKIPEILNGDNYTEWYNLHKEMHDKLAHKIFELEKEIKDMCERDPKTGRFVSTKANSNNETTNKINLKKENDTMMNKNNAEKRMETLRSNGVNVDNFFNLNLQIPFGAEVRLTVDGKEMVIPATTMETTATAYGNHVVGKATPVIFNNPTIIDGATLLNDSIAQSIIDDGYVKNSKLFRRFVLAHTFKLLEYVDRKNPNRKGWEAGFKDMYSYGYQFEMLADELHTLAKLQKEDPEYFEERTKFFNGDVAVATLNDYLYRLKKYCKKQMRENPRKYRGQAYVKLARYGYVLVKDLDMKVYRGIEHGIDCVKGAVYINNYVEIEKAFKDFMANYYNKLPYDTPKCAVFKDAYKGAGAFYSLQNMIRFHGCDLSGCRGKYGSEEKLVRLLNSEYKNEVWRFYELLVNTIVLNKFDLKQSIANGNAAPNTKSDKADRY